MGIQGEIMLNNEGNRILGIEVSKYPKLCYILVLIASGFGLFANLLGLMNFYVGGSLITGLLGLIGIALAATAYVGFKDRFSNVDNSHFLFLIILFVAFLILVFIIGGIFENSGIIGAIILFLMSAFQFALIFAGFNLWRGGQAVTKENLISALKNLTSKMKK